jgi:hypothetical protein
MPWGNIPDTSPYIGEMVFLPRSGSVSVELMFPAFIYSLQGIREKKNQFDFLFQYIPFII